VKKISYYPLEAISFVPICGWLGDNLIEVNVSMLWYKGWHASRWTWSNSIE